PILRFFAAYPSFDYNPGLRPYSSHTSEFNRLCEVMEWGKKGRRRKAARKEFQEALVRWFNEAYGVDAECLEAWQELCKDSRIHPVPGTLVKARKTMFNTHVNLMDLADARRHPDHRLIKFATEKELSQYTLKAGKMVPASSDEASGVSRALLRYI
ncbi:hypothetical protein FA13DRAFT_1585634, partial [Coprinellus micaceus]